jgi:hypothetical protein
MRATTKNDRFPWLTTLAAVCLVLTSTGCATEALSHRGSAVELTTQVDRGCKNLGPVIGKGGGFLGGSWVSDEDLVEYAMNDLRNKAGDRGATHVVFTGHEMGHTSGEHGGTTSTATISGIAYRCPAEAAPAPAPVQQSAQR